MASLGQTGLPQALEVTQADEDEGAMSENDMLVFMSNGKATSKIINHPDQPCDEKKGPKKSLFRSVPEVVLHGSLKACVVDFTNNNYYYINL